jgi:hypothetical protein
VITDVNDTSNLRQSYSTSCTNEYADLHRFSLPQLCSQLHEEKDWHDRGLKHLWVYWRFPRTRSIRRWFTIRDRVGDRLRGWRRGAFGSGAMLAAVLEETARISLAAFAEELHDRSSKLSEEDAAGLQAKCKPGILRF